MDQTDQKNIPTFACYTNIQAPGANSNYRKDTGNSDLEDTLQLSNTFDKLVIPQDQLSPFDTTSSAAQKEAQKPSKSSSEDKFAYSIQGAGKGDTSTN